MDRARRKALLQAYKLAFPPMGIYAVRNRVSGRMLIEQSANTTGALNRHLTQLRLGMHRIRALQEDWRELGEDAFVFEVLQAMLDWFHHPRSSPPTSSWPTAET